MGLAEIDNFLSADTPRAGGLAAIDDYLEQPPASSTWRDRMFKTGQETLADPNATTGERFLAGVTTGMRSVPSPFRPLPGPQATLEEIQQDPLPTRIAEVPMLPFSMAFSGVTRGLEEAGVISRETTENLAKIPVALAPMFMAPPPRPARSIPPLRAKQAMTEAPPIVRPIPEPGGPPMQPVEPPVAPRARPMGPVPEPTVTLGSLGGGLQDIAGYLPESVRNLPATYWKEVQKGLDYISAKTPSVLPIVRPIPEPGGPPMQPVEPPVAPRARPMGPVPEPLTTVAPELAMPEVIRRAIEPTRPAKLPAVGIGDVQEVRFDAKQEKAKIAGYRAGAEEPIPVPRAESREPSKMEGAAREPFFGEVDRLAAEEAGLFRREPVGAPMRVETPEGARAVTAMDPRLMKVLGGNLYSGDLGVVAVKEMLQNATDSLRALEKPGTGTVRASVDSVKRTITVTDTGAGMTPEVATRELVDIGGSSKAEGSAGGFGIAKVAIFSNAEDIRIVSVAKDSRTGKVVSTTLHGTGLDWADPAKGLSVESKPMPPDAQTGTTMTIRLSQETPFSLGPSRDFLQAFADTHRLEGKFTLEVNGSPVTPGAGPPVERIASLPIQEATIDIYASKETKRVPSIDYVVLNKGLPQFRDAFWTGNDLPLPERVILDVKPTAGPESAGYPFRPDRQGFRGHVTDSLNNYFMQQLMADAAQADRAMYAKSFKEGRPIGRTGIHLIDTTGALPTKFLDALASEPHLATIAEQIKVAFHLLQAELPGLPQAEFGGIGLSERFLATNVMGKAVFGEGAKNLILVNPYSVLAEVEQAIRLGQVKRAQAREHFGDRLVAVLIHELSHQGSRAHGEEFAGILTRSYATLSRTAVKVADRIAYGLSPRDLFGRSTDVYDGAAKALGQLQPLWQTAPDIFGKISTGLAEPSRGGRPTGGPRTGPAGGTGPEGPVRGRSEVQAGRVEPSPTVRTRPTRVREEVARPGGPESIPGPGPVAPGGVPEGASRVPEPIRSIVYGGRPAESSVPPPAGEPPVTLGSLGGALQEAARYLPESIRNLNAKRLAFMQRGIDALAAKLPKVFREARGLGEEYVDAVHDRGATLANYVERAVELSGKLQHGLTNAEKARVDQVLRGGITVNPAIQRIVEPVRGLINELQGKLIEYGYLTPEDVQLFQERFRSHPDYLRRLYETKLVPPEQPFLSGELTGPVGRGVKSEALMMRGDIQEVKLPPMGGEPLVGAQRADFLQPWLKKGYRLIKAEGDTATLFRDIPEPIRKAMGEVRTKPGFVAAKTAVEQARIVANHEFLAKIAENPEWAKAGLTDAELASGAWTRLTGDKKKWGPLADFFVKKDVALEVQNSIRIRQDWEKVVGRLVGLWKYGKVILNPAAMGRNIISSGILADFGGLHPWMVDEWAKGANQIRKGDGVWPEAKQMGLFRSGFAQNEILALSEGIAKSTQPNGMLRMLDAVHEIAEAAGQKTGVRPSRLYAAIENFYRFNLYRYARETLNQSPKDARRYALKYAIDYEVVSPAVAALRGTGGGWAAPLAALVGAPFATFSAKAIPLTLETLALHPIRVLKYPAIIYGISKMAGPMIGQREEETTAQRALGGLNWLRYALIPWRDKDERSQYFDLGYTLPFGDLIETWDWATGGMGRRANIAFAPIVGHPSFAMFEAIANRATFTGKDISEPSDTALQSLQKRVGHIYQSWAPSLAPPLPGLPKGGYGYEDLRRAFAVPPETDFMGRTRSPVASVLANVAGLRAQGVTTAELANFKAKQYEAMLDSLDKEALQIATKYRLNPEEANRRMEQLKQRAIEIATEAKSLFSLVPRGASRPAVPAQIQRAVGAGR